MSSFTRNSDYPEAMVKVLLTVMSKSSEGGATMADLKSAYCEARDRIPHTKTIQRTIRRLNILFDPLAYTGGDSKNSQADEFAPEKPAIETLRQNGQIRYRFTRDVQAKPVDPSLAFMMALSLFPQQRGMLGGQFEVVMKLVFEEVLSRLANYCNLYGDIRKYVYVSGPEPLEPEQNFRKIEITLQAIRMKKRVKIEYLRSYDGELTTREIEPYGFVCRFNNWYLTGKCIEKNQRRIFLLSQIRRIQLVENSIWSAPPGFCLKEEYDNNWGVWTEDKLPSPETIRLRVGKGLAERFRVNRFHESQQIKELPGGSIEVTFSLSGAREMIPWLMSWGPAVELLGPQWLCNALAENLEKSLSLYRVMTNSFPRH